ncbi:hypothetical protein ACRAQ6_07710 [Erythrobacter sp. HA6-11]
MKFAKAALFATAFAAMPAAALAADVNAGATVYGPEGNEVGTIASVTDGQAVLDTGKHQVPLGVESFGENETGLTITVTKAQINSMMDEQLAAANARRDAALVEGATVMSADGMQAGTVYTVDDADTAIVQSDAGIITLPRDAFALDANGNLMALYSAEQIAANMVEVPEGAEILTPAQAEAKRAEMEADSAS